MSAALLAALLDCCRCSASAWAPWRPPIALAAAAIAFFSGQQHTASHVPLHCLAVAADTADWPTLLMGVMPLC